MTTKKFLKPSVENRKENLIGNKLEIGAMGKKNTVCLSES